MRGSRRALKGAGPSWGSGAQESFSERKCFPTQSFSRQTVGVLLQKEFLNLIRKWNPMVFQHIGYFRDNTGRRTEVVCDDQPNALRPSVTHRNGGGGGDGRQDTLLSCQGEGDCTGCHLPFVQSPVWRTGLGDWDTWELCTVSSPVATSRGKTTVNWRTVQTLPKHTYLQNSEATRGSLTGIK